MASQGDHLTAVVVLLLVAVAVLVWTLAALELVALWS
jgi:hypothetical protein